jgi:hypothetical protein
MNKTIVDVLAVATLAVGFASSACTVAPLCPSGQVQCGNSCMPAGNVCCPDGVSSCPSSYVCSADSASCIPDVVNRGEQACQSCVASGQFCCPNFDGTVDCAPVTSVAQCCGNHTHCNTGVCLSNGTCS